MRTEKLDDEMTLRDFFAAAALQGRLANPKLAKVRQGPPETAEVVNAMRGTRHRQQALRAYELADAMLERRGGPDVVMELRAALEREGKKNRVFCAELQELHGEMLTAINALDLKDKVLKQYFGGTGQ